ncbi:hypothetical protein Nepgr_027766 [Nepenthes gracilis]|uniref:Uncharacterized protein n=1 Tax=Nepenthes gracilis TaxID=150966 RepID=A0AAD3T9C5_NEPGR|nr:hypothetical protein Nepgr_027766 [Nepenthes gracilis]
MLVDGSINIKGNGSIHSKAQLQSFLWEHQHSLSLWNRRKLLPRHLVRDRLQHVLEPPRPFLSRFSLEVEQINFKDNQTLTAGIPMQLWEVWLGTGHDVMQGNSPNLTGSPFLFSSKDNVFLVGGCTGSALLLDSGNRILAWCATICPQQGSSMPSSENCYGRALMEGKKEDILAVANLARRCLHLDGKCRPTMKEAAKELEAVGASYMLPSSEKYLQ